MRIIFTIKSEMELLELASRLSSHIKGACEDVLFKAIKLMRNKKEIVTIHNPKQLIEFGERIEMHSAGCIKANDIYTALANENKSKDTRNLLAQLLFNNSDNKNSISIPAPGRPNQDVLSLLANSQSNSNAFVSYVLKTLSIHTLNPAIEAGAIICLSNDLTTSSHLWYGHHYIRLAFLDHNEEFRFIVRRDSKAYIQLKQAIDVNTESEKYTAEARNLYPNHVVMQYIEQDHRFTVSKDDYDLLLSSPEKLAVEHPEMLISHYICDRF